LPIGGLKEKVLGAARAGITEIVLPKENEPELEDLPEEVRKTLTFHPVETLEEVLSLALRSRDAKAVDELLSTSSGR
jgi:ATP-dependent Lon protease